MVQKKEKKKDLNCILYAFTCIRVNEKGVWGSPREGPVHHFMPVLSELNDSHEHLQLGPSATLVWKMFADDCQTGRLQPQHSGPVSILREKGEGSIKHNAHGGSLQCRAW